MPACFYKFNGKKDKLENGMIFLGEFTQLLEENPFEYDVRRLSQGALRQAQDDSLIAQDDRFIVQEDSLIVQEDSLIAQANSLIV